MKRIMKVAALTACAEVMLGLTGCDAGSRKTPDAVVVKVLQAVQEGKASQEFLAENCTESTAALFTTFGALVQSAIKGATFTVSKTFIDDNIATVKIKQTGGEKPGEEAYYLKKIDGNWKLDVNKENPGKDCISQTTLKRLAMAFKSALVNWNETELRKDITGDGLKFLEEMAKEFKTGSENEKKEFIAAQPSEMSGTASGNGEEGFITFRFGKEQFPFKVKRENGVWKLGTIKID